jgi:hypothetical protein
MDSNDQCSDDQQVQITPATSKPCEIPQVKKSKTSHGEPSSYNPEEQSTKSAPASDNYALTRLMVPSPIQLEEAVDELGDDGRQERYPSSEEEDSEELSPSISARIHVPEGMKGNGNLMPE